jgi:hypothetical protein
MRVSLPWPLLMSLCLLFVGVVATFSMVLTLVWHLRRRR